MSPRRIGPTEDSQLAMDFGSTDQPEPVAPEVERARALRRLVGLPESLTDRAVLGRVHAALLAAGSGANHGERRKAS